MPNSPQRNGGGSIRCTTTRKSSMKEASTRTPPASVRSCSESGKPMGSTACPPAQQEQRTGHQHHADDHRRRHRPDPRHGDEKEHVPREQRGRPPQEQPQPGVVGDVPDTEAEAEDQDPVPPVRAGQHGKAEQHHQGRELPAHLDRGHDGRQGDEREAEALRVVDGPQIHHDGRLDVRHRHREGDQPGDTPPHHSRPTSFTAADCSTFSDLVSRQS